MRQSISQILAIFQKIPPHEQNPKHVLFKPKHARTLIDQARMHILIKRSLQTPTKHPYTCQSPLRPCVYFQKETSLDRQHVTT